MKKLAFPLLLALAACNNTPADKAQSAESVPAPTPAPLMTGPQPYFAAKGNEPGWILEMEAAQDGTFPVVLINHYGEDTLTGRLEKGPLMSDGKPTVGSHEVKFMGVLESKTKGESVQISLNGEGCTDDAGMKHQVACKITIGKETLQGCGDYKE